MGWIGFALLMGPLGAKDAALASGASQVIYAPPASWVAPAPIPTKTPTPVEAPARFIYSDEQIRVGPNGQETYSAYRVRILKPEALPLGNISLTWDPSSGSATVHTLRIIRAGQTIDVLASQRFQVIQRENGLEQAALDGRLTAIMQVPGLQTDDELEVALTTSESDTVLGGHAFGINQAPLQGMPGAYRVRLVWPEGKSLNLRATRDLAQPAPVVDQAQKSVEFELRDPAGVILNAGAPPRINVRRLAEYSDFSSWSDVSQAFAPLFEQSSTLAAKSPIHGEAAAIAAASRDPRERAQAALRVVQDKIRYVYVGLNGGNYRPASADETWQRRFGDCKAKTAVLLALLHELDIDAEPVLVNLQGDDGANERLPSPGIFDHVLVRASIAGTAYWLDGTRLGDHYLDNIPSPTFHWALPLRAAGSELEAVPTKPNVFPQLVSAMDIDASAGLDRPAIVKIQRVMHYDDALTTRSQLSAISSQDADRALREYWRKEMDWLRPDEVSWRYDERRATLILSVIGQGDLKWKGNDKNGRSFELPDAGFYAPDILRRPKEQDQSAPWAIQFPHYVCYATSVHLPAADGRWRWTYYADPMNQQLAGVAYWRASGMKDTLVRTVMSRRALVSEITADEAKEANIAIPDFNNNISTVFQATKSEAHAAHSDPLPFGDMSDWSGEVPACHAPA